MVTHMKTTLEISEALMKELKQKARNEGTTMRVIIEKALQSYLTKPREERYAINDASFEGNGLQSGVDLADWPRIRGMIYEGHGDDRP